MLVPITTRLPSYLIHRIVPSSNFFKHNSKNFFSFTAKSSPLSNNMNNNNNQNQNNQNLVGREIDLLDTKDLRFRLPGNVGIVNNSLLMKIKNLNENNSQNNNNNNNNQLNSHHKNDQQKQQEQNMKNAIVEMSYEEILNQLMNDADKAMPSEQLIYDYDEFKLLNCEAYECPLLLIKDFQELFPHSSINLSNGLTVLTITHKTENDMSVWSKDVYDEREKLLEKFVDLAQRMCNYLKDNGYWADFVDPSSGRPYYGDYTPATFFETDERYRRFGFEIEDLGCCKVLSHKRWGTNAFVGALFTNATHNSDVVQRLVITLDD